MNDFTSEAAICSQTTLSQAGRIIVEPFCVCADVFSRVQSISTLTFIERLHPHHAKHKTTEVILFERRGTLHFYSCINTSEM